MGEDAEPQTFIQYVAERIEGGHRPFHKSKILVLIILAIISLTMGYAFTIIPKPHKKARNPQQKQKLDNPIPQPKLKSKQSWLEAMTICMQVSHPYRLPHGLLLHYF